MMRIMGFSEYWPKLDNKIIFTTFRYPRRDKDWEVEEVVQVVYRPRTKERETLGIARIIRKQEKDMDKDYHSFFFKSFLNDDVITPSEAYEDGFSSMGHGDIKGLLNWIRKSNKGRFLLQKKVYKLTLYWIDRFNAK